MLCSIAPCYEGRRATYLMSPILEEGRNLFGATATVLRKNIW